MTTTTAAPAAPTAAPLTFTPGPWLAQSRGLSDNSLVVVSAKTATEVCMLRERGERSYSDADRIALANAALIQEAPAMVELLREMLDFANHNAPLHPGALLWNEARAIFARATGAR